MTTGISDPSKTFLANKFWVEIEGMLEAYFTEVSGMTAQTEVLEYKEGGTNTFTHKLPTRTSFTNITLKRGMTTSTKFWDWYMNTVNKGVGKAAVQLKDISIILYSPSEAATTIRRWNVSNAYPIKWVGPSMATKSAEYAVETIEIAYDKFTLVS